MFDRIVLRELRRLALLSRRDLAERVPCTERAVGQWESGQYTPSAKSITRLAAILDVPEEYFFRPEASGLTDDEVHRVVVSSRLAQGLAPRITDPAVLGFIATVLGANTVQRAS